MKLDWTADPDSTDFSLDWRDDHTDWATLTGGGSSGPRVTIYSANTTAVVHGLPQRSGNLYFKITATAEDGRTAMSQVRGVPRSAPPKAYGHQHDHVASYSLSNIQTGSVAAKAKAAARYAEQEWSRNVRAHGVDICEKPCPANADTPFINVELGDSGNRTENYACGASIACVGPVGSTVENHLGSANLTIEEPPYEGTRTAGDNRRFKWTRNSSMNLKPTGGPQMETWRFIDAVMVHEFGHILGLPDFSSAESHLGVMKNFDTYQTVKVADVELVEGIYENHAPNAGW